jgi:hypothetical protein
MSHRYRVGPFRVRGSEIWRCQTRVQVRDGRQLWLYPLGLDLGFAVQVLGLKPKRRLVKMLRVR